MIPDEIGAREREAQRRPRSEIVAREDPALSGDLDQRCAGRIARTALVRSAPSLAPSTRTRASRQPPPSATST
jgi:hypothetical protein